MGPNISTNNTTTTTEEGRTEEKGWGHCQGRTASNSASSHKQPVTALLKQLLIYTV